LNVVVSSHADNVDTGGREFGNTAFEMSIGLETIIETLDDVTGKHYCIDIVGQCPFNAGTPRCRRGELVDTHTVVFEMLGHAARATAEVDVANAQ